MRFFRWIKMEFLKVIPAFIFFFTAFSLINMTEGLMLRRAGFSPFGGWTIFVASAVVAKVLVIVDSMPWINIFPRPLIYNVVWKTLLYSFFALLVRVGDRLLPEVWEHGWREGFPNFIAIVNWTLFWAIQIWYMVLFFIFVVFREIFYAVGPARIRRIFFK